jgi:SAM-dependent methyltransferase
MRSFGHWTPRYIVSRIAEKNYYRTHPDLPWLTRTANEMLSTYLSPADSGLEFGSGRSTLWFARRVAHLTSVEHDATWHAKVTQMLKENNLSNVDYQLHPRNLPDEQGGETDYVKVIQSIKSDSVDFVLVDGVYRDFCALEAIRVIRPGGLMVIDNVHRYLPSDSSAPYARSFAEGPKGETWKKVYQVISQWRKIWTHSGVNDTAFFFKPFN